MSGLKERGKEVFQPTDEKITEIANEIYHSLCIVLVFRIFSIFYYKKSNHFEL
jgi:hypothetical protein